MKGLPRWAIPSLAIASSFALLPYLFIAKARSERSPVPRVEIIPDMDNQPRFSAQQANALFADGRAMRSPVHGTVARGELNEDDHLHRGIVGAGWAERFPMRVSRAMIERGRDRYEIYCSPCHGLGGKGDGMVSRRADELEQPTWIPPSDLHTELVRERPVGHLYNTIANGIRNMPAYASQVGVEDRWAIVAYIRALQRSQHATPDDMPADVRSRFETKKRTWSIK